MSPKVRWFNYNIILQQGPHNNLSKNKSKHKLMQCHLQSESLSSQATCFLITNFHNFLLVLKQKHISSRALKSLCLKYWYHGSATHCEIFGIYTTYGVNTSERQKLRYEENSKRNISLTYTEEYDIRCLISGGSKH